MKRLSSTLRHLLVVFVFSLAFASLAHAQSQRTFVSITGSDANTASLCSNAAPCRSFGAAQGVTNSGGEIIALTSGGYGPVTITRAIQITAPSGVYAAISQIGAGDAITINAGATDVVVIRGLTLNGLSGAVDGIDWNTGATLHVENCVINGFLGSGIAFNAAGELFVKDTIVRNINDNDAISVNDNAIELFTTSGTITASIDNCRIENNGANGFDVGDNAFVSITNSIAVGNGASGFDASGNSNVTVANSVAADNGSSGYRAGSGGEMNVEYCVARGNGSNGMFVTGLGSIMRVSNSISVNNSTGFSNTNSGTFESRQNNTVQNNTTNNTNGVITNITGT